MKLLTTIALLCFSVVANAEAKSVVSKRCTSSSGLSIYDIELVPNTKKGKIRYRFMGQDVFYDITIEDISDESISGVAVFKSSRSGETQGNPFSFKYNFEQNTFVEGSLSFNCSLSSGSIHSGRFTTHALRAIPRPLSRISHRID